MLVFILLITLSNGSSSKYLFETDQLLTLRNNHIEVTISKKTGYITSMLAAGNKMLTNNCSMNITDRVSKTSITPRLSRKLDNYPYQAAVYLTYRLSDRKIEFQYTIDSIAFNWRVTVTNTTHHDKEINLDFRLPMRKHIDRFFYPGLNQAINLTISSHIVLTYRKHLYIPIVTGYSTIKNWGVSVMAPLEIPKPGLQFSVDDEEITVSFQHLRCKPHEKTSAAIEIVTHQPDWRPALSYLLKRYPEYFYPAVAETTMSEGWFYLSFPFVNEQKIQNLSNRMTRWVELHEYFPFYGLYAPNQDKWGIIIDSDDISLENWSQGDKGKINSYKHMMNLIDLWHKYGIRVYLYFQSFEAWHHYAKTYFADDIALDRSNEALSSWKFTSLMNPDPEYKWGQHILAQSHEIMKRYPQIDGIFYDRMDYEGYDFAHSDDVTMIAGQPAYMLGFAQERIAAKLFEVFHAKRLGIWGNGPTSIEVCRNLDGIMAEKSLPNLTRIQYLGLVRPIIYLPYDNLPDETEGKLKNALLCGAFPAVSYGGQSCQSLEGKYAPLFDLLKNKMWVLEPAPLDFPENVQGNIFKKPNGDYLVVIVSPDKSQLPPHPFQYNLQIDVHLPNPSEIRYAYLLSGDWAGVNALSIERNDRDLMINIPFHLSSSMILLTNERRYDFVRSSSPILLKGTDAKIVFQRSDGSPTAVTLSTPWQEETRIARDTVEFTINIHDRQAGETQMEVDCDNRTYAFSSWVVNPVSIKPAEEIFIHHRDGDLVRFEFVNNTGREVNLRLDANFTEGTGRIETPANLRLGPFQSAGANVFIQPLNYGVVQINAVSNGYAISENFSVSGRSYPAENYLFYEDFRNTMQNWITHSGTWEVSKGIAYGYGRSHFAYMANSNWRDYSYELTTRCLGSDNPKVDWLKTYIFFRVQDNDNFYRFGIHGDAGVVDLYKCIKGKWSRITTTTFTPGRNRWYTMKISVKGSHLAGYIDGKKILEAVDKTFLVGGIGFGVMEDDMRCEYKDIVVHPN